MDNNIRKLIDDNWDDKELIAQKAETEQKTKTIWDLNIEDEEDYYRLYSDEDIAKLFFSSISDVCARDMGNAFLTEEEAKFELERRNIEVIMKKYARPFVEGEVNYSLLYNYEDKIISTGYYWSSNNGLPYFETEGIAQKVIDEIGEDRLKKYWFGVTE